MNITFVSPYYLWFLASIPFLIILHLISLRFTKRKALLFANFEAIRRVEGGFLSGGIVTKNVLFLILRCFTLLFIVFSLAGAIVWHQGRTSRFDFVVAVDASGSMLANDFSPSRLDAAKSAATKFVDALATHSRVGVISFSGTTFVKQRLTDDPMAAKNAIQKIEIEFASGTAIGDAVISSANLFDDQGNARAVVILTDGQSNVGVLPEEAVAYANKNHISIYTLGVATEQGGAFKDIDAISKLDEPTLQSMASSTGGQYFKATDDAQLSQAFSTIASTANRNVPLRLQVPLLVLALCLLFVEWLMINTRYRTIP